MRIWVRDGGKCVYCNGIINPSYYQETVMFNKVAKHFGWYVEPMETDHFIPFAKNGSQKDENMVAACKSCNRKKSDNSGWQKRNPSIIGRILYQLYPMISKELKQELNSRKEK